MAHLRRHQQPASPKQLHLRLSGTLEETEEGAEHTVEVVAEQVHRAVIRHGACPWAGGGGGGAVVDR